MKNIIIGCLSLLVLVFLSSCEKDDNSDMETPVLKLSEVIYTLSAEQDLELALHSSTPVAQNTVVKFNTRGSAVEGEEYELSAKEFVFQAGDTVAKITVSPKEHYSTNKTIKIELQPVEGFRFGEFNFALIQVMANAQLICSFEQDSYVLPKELDVTMVIKNVETGNFYSSHPQEFRVPFEVDPSSTAQEGVHYQFVNNPNKEFIFAPNKYKGTIKIKMLKWVKGKTDIRLKVNTDSKAFLAGSIDMTNIVVKGPTTVKELTGKWAFKEARSWDYFQNDPLMPEGDRVNLPKNNSVQDILEFVNEGNQLKTHLTGDLQKYFRDCDVKYLKEKLMYLNEDGNGGRPPRVTISIMELSEANVNFSSSDKKLRPVQIGFRILEDDETLEVSIIDFEPIDFLHSTYLGMVAAAGPGKLPMEDTYPIRYHFKRVQ